MTTSIKAFSNGLHKAPKPLTILPGHMVNAVSLLAEVLIVIVLYLMRRRNTKQQTPQSQPQNPESCVSRTEQVLVQLAKTIVRTKRRDL